MTIGLTVLLVLVGMIIIVFTVLWIRDFIMQKRGKGEVKNIWENKS